MKTDEQKYRFEVLDGIPVFETRYYAQKFVDDHYMEFVKQGGSPSIEKGSRGFVIMVIRSEFYRYKKN